MAGKKVIQDVERILLLSQRVLAYLRKNKIAKAKRALRKIIRFDLDELSRLQREHGDKKLMEECALVFRDAKRALMNLDSVELFEEAKSLIDEIARLEGHELMEIKEGEKKSNEIYQFWHDTVLKIIAYHGTSSLSIPKVMKYGLAPSMRPYFYEKFQRLFQLYKKAGKLNPLKLTHLSGGVNEGELVTKGFFITSSYRSAVTYARLSPAIWNEFLERATVGAKRDYTKAKLFFFRDAFFPFGIQKKLSSDDEEAIRCYTDLTGTLEQLFYHDPRNAYEKMRRYAEEKYGLAPGDVCRLKKSEVYEILRLFDQLWDILETMKNEIRPIVLHILISAPAIAKQFVDDSTGERYLMNFNAFLKVFVDFFEEDKEHAVATIKEFMIGYQFFVDERIPPEYIVKYEEV